jgi:hypothetical protein
MSPHVGCYLAISIANKPTTLLKKLKKKKSAILRPKKEMKE